MAYIATLGDQTHRIEIQELEKDHLYRIIIDGVERDIDGRKLSAHMYTFLIDNRSFTADVTAKDDIYTVVCEGRSFRLQHPAERRALRTEQDSSRARRGAKEV